MVFLLFLIGLCVGSFLNVLADRLPRGESVLWGRSRCDHCKKKLRWFELIPVASFMVQRGRCRRCHKQLSLQYPIVEVATALGCMWIFLLFPYSFTTLPYYALFCALLVLFVADLRYRILPDSMIVVGVIAATLLRLLSPTFSPYEAILYVLSATGASGFLYLLWALTRGRGMGFGDVKLAILMGLILGFPNIIIAFYIAFLTGALVGVILILVGRKGWKSHIAFGPFLILGTVVAFFWSNQILTWWMTLL